MLEYDRSANVIVYLSAKAPVHIDAIPTASYVIASTSLTSVVFAIAGVARFGS